MSWIRRRSVSFPWVGMLCCLALLQEAGAGLVRLGPGDFTPAATVITFSEPGYPTGTVNPVYVLPAGSLGTVTVSFAGIFDGQTTRPSGGAVTLKNNIPAGPLALNSLPTAFITTDGANPTSPVLSGSPRFNGPIAVLFSVPVAAVGLDGGYFDALQGTTIEAFGANGNSLGAVVNEQKGIEFFGLAHSTGQRVIRGISFYITGEEWSGFGIDNLTFGALDVLAPGIITPVLVTAREVTDLGAIDSLMKTGLPMAASQPGLVLHAARAAIRDLNARLFRARAGAAPVEPREGAEGDGRPFTVFAAGDYARAQLDDRGELGGFDGDTAAFSAGAEARLAPALSLGVGATLLKNDTDFGRGVGRTDIEGQALALYATYSGDGFFGDALYSVGFWEHRLRRNTGLGAAARADVDSTTHALDLNGGYRWQRGRWTTGPIVGLEYLAGKVDGYTERGGANADLKVDGQSFESLLSRVGWQASRPLESPIGRVTPQLRASWNHEYAGADDTLGLELVQSPFMTVKGDDITRHGSFGTRTALPGVGRDYLAVGAGLLWQGQERVFIVLDYEGHFLRDDQGEHFGSIRIGFEF